MDYYIHPSRVINGEDVFKLHDTYGLPLEMSAVIAIERNMVIDWGSFIQAAEKVKWNVESLKRRIKAACEDAGCNDDYMFRISEESLEILRGEPLDG